MRKVWTIENLDCANCAAKLEDALRRVPGVESVQVNFLAKTVTLTAADDAFEEVTARVVKRAAQVEPDAEILTDGATREHPHEHQHHHEHGCDCGHDHQHECACGHDHDHGHDHNSHGHDHGGEENEKLLLVRIAAALVLLVVGMLLPAGAVRTVLLLAAYLIAGYDVLLRAAKNISRGQIFDENFLMTVASIGALIMGEYPEGVAVMTLYQIGEWFQDRAVERSRSSIASLMDIRPDSANLLQDGEVRVVSPEEVSIGSTILVRPGEKVPLDGEILEGTSSLNTVALTGESLPRDVQAGDRVISGCVNLSGVLTVRVTSLYGESTVARILQLVESSGNNKASSEKFITKFARYYTPAVCATALLLAIIPSIVTGDWSRWVTQALSFLVISCPCALVISVPLSFFSGIGGASRKGILVKGANYMETLSQLDTVAFDKTGTLTQGVFSVTAIHPNEVSPEDLLEVAALAECYSSHPISRSLQAAYNRLIDRTRVTDVEEIAGHGIKAVVDGRTVYAGNDKLLAQIGVKARPCHHQGTIVHIARQDEYLGHIVISDVLKPTSEQAMSELKREGVQRLVMLTGDRKAVAEDMAEKLGLTDVRAELLPEDKVKALENLMNQGRRVGFVGDGINDAPVLRRADLGIAMGALGSDAAIEAADVVLMDDDPLKLPLAMRIARRTMRIVHQNIVFALGVKAIILVLGFLGVTNMWLAVFADVGVAMLAILNAMRAMRIR